MKQRLLYIFTRTPLHVGAGSSVGAIDQPVQRERHTGFPLIPASSLKGTFADAWNDGLYEQGGKRNLRVTTKHDENDREILDQASEAAWLFGSDNANHSFAGALQFSEARLLAFPVRSARGSFAWVTCPLILQRAVRDGVLEGERKQIIQELSEPPDDSAIFAPGKLDIGTSKNGGSTTQVVLEEYAFACAGDSEATKLGSALAGLLPDDPVWQGVRDRLLIVSNGMMSFFCKNACEVAQHVRISDETGTAEGGALFNQENVPTEAFFYTLLNAYDERTINKAKDNRRKAEEALDAFKQKADSRVFQFGGDGSTGLGYCTVQLDAQI